MFNENRKCIDPDGAGLPILYSYTPSCTVPRVITIVAAILNMIGRIIMLASGLRLAAVGAVIPGISSSAFQQSPMACQYMIISEDIIYICPRCTSRYNLAKARQ